MWFVAHDFIYRYSVISVMGLCNSFVGLAVLLQTVNRFATIDGFGPRCMSGKSLNYDIVRVLLTVYTAPCSDHLPVGQPDYTNVQHD